MNHPNKKYILQRICRSSFALWMFILLMDSCHGQDKPKIAVENKPTDEPLRQEQGIRLDTSDQISEYVVEVFEDKKGSLWFGTMSDGAVRYDGKTLRYFSIKEGLGDVTVASIAEDLEGNLWFGTHAGASKYDGKSFTNFADAEGLHGSGCHILVDRNGNIWAGTTLGVFRYNGFSFAAFNIPNPFIKDPSSKMRPGKVWSLMEDKKGNIWFARDGYGACKYDGTAFTHFTQQDGLCSNNVCGIAEDKHGNMWFGSLSSDNPVHKDEGGLSRYDGKTFTKYPGMEGLSNNDIYSIYADKVGNIWIGATGLGVYRYDGTSFKLYKGTDRMDLSWSMGIQSVLEARNGTIWFGFSGGLFRFNGSAITNVTKADLFTNR